MSIFYKLAPILDIYKVREIAPSIHGALITAVVSILTIVYSSREIYNYQNKDYPRTNIMEWTPALGSFPIQILCETLSGCFISNVYKKEYTPDYFPPDAPSCAFVNYQQTIQMFIAYTTHPNDGLSVIFRSNDTNPDFPPEYGASVVSYAECIHGLPCVDNVLHVLLRFTKGISTWTYVHTTDERIPKDSSGRERDEWFGTPIGESYDFVDLDKAPCLRQYNQSWRNYSQAFLKLGPFFNQVTIHDKNWYFLVGVIGGTFDALIKAGGVLLALFNLTSLLCKHPKHYTYVQYTEPKQSEDTLETLQID